MKDRSDRMFDVALVLIGALVGMLSTGVAHTLQMRAARTDRLQAHALEYAPSVVGQADAIDGVVHDMWRTYKAGWIKGSVPSRDSVVILRARIRTELAKLRTTGELVPIFFCAEGERAWYGMQASADSVSEVAMEYLTRRESPPQKLQAAVRGFGNQRGRLLAAISLRIRRQDAGECRRDTWDQDSLYLAERGSTPPGRQ